MYQKQILMEKLKEATASVLPISLIVMAISFVLVPVDAGLMLSFVIATAMLILGMGLFTLGADMSMSRIGNYMGSKLTKSRKLPLILTVSFALARHHGGGAGFAGARGQRAGDRHNGVDLDRFGRRRLLSDAVHGTHSLFDLAAHDADRYFTPSSLPRRFCRMRASSPSRSTPAA